jgi:hypothetical protein
LETEAVERLHKLETEFEHRLRKLETNTDKRVHTVETRQIVVQTLLGAMLVAQLVAVAKMAFKSPSEKLAPAAQRKLV